MHIPSAEPPLRRAVRTHRLDDVDDLLDREPQLVIGCEEVRAEADPGAGPEVAEDAPLLELRIDRRALGHREDHRAAAPVGLAPAVDLDPGRISQVDEQARLPERVLADPIDADLLDEVVARGSGHVRGRVRSAR